MPSPDGAPVRLFATLGDSVTAGTPGHTVGLWPQLVTDWLRLYAVSVRHLALAADGATSGDVLEDQLPRAIGSRPDLVTVICGANDVLLYPRPDLAQLAANVEEILRLLAEEVRPWRIVTATYPDFGPFLAWRPRSKARVITGLASLNDLIRYASDRVGALCVDLADASRVHGVDAFAPDGVHPSQIGHRRIAVAMIRALADRLHLPAERPYPWEQQ